MGAFEVLNKYRNTARICPYWNEFRRNSIQLMPNSFYGGKVLAVLVPRTHPISFPQKPYQTQLTINKTFQMFLAPPCDVGELKMVRLVSL